jgi:hypothetical protein
VGSGTPAWGGEAAAHETLAVANLLLVACLPRTPVTLLLVAQLQGHTHASNAIAGRETSRIHATSIYYGLKNKISNIDTILRFSMDIQCCSSVQIQCYIEVAQY